jgi:hypothetical protein
VHDIIEEKPQVPSFLKEIILGYGNDENVNSFKRMHSHPQSVAFSLLDTFVDEAHYRESFKDNADLP